MKVVIIGWYGTETIGDRAILAGLLNVLSEVFPKLYVNIGSLYPILTERTLIEDCDFYQEIASNKIGKISVFDSRSPLRLRNAIKHADILLVGGGPLMDLTEMSMLEYAFVVAKMCKVKSFMLGCGWGPLKEKKTIRTAVHLVEMSDHTVFRDATSLEQCCQHKIFQNVQSSIDPAFFACHYFRESVREGRRGDYIAVNFRDVAAEGNHYSNRQFSDEMFCDIVRQVLGQTKMPVYLIPMHYFQIGGDDRIILGRIHRLLECSQVRVVHEPQSLKQTMDLYYHADMCIGMRFHSVVLQTILNGRNYIIDYTDPQTGKIVGMMRQLRIEEKYADRYYSLQSSGPMPKMNVNSLVRYQYDKRTIDDEKQVYLNVLRQL